MERFTIRPVLWIYQKNEKEIYSIKIAVTVQRKVTYVLTGYKVHKSQWNDVERKVQKHENATLINVTLRRQIADLERKLTESNLQGSAISKRVIKNEKISRNFYKYAVEVRDDQTKIRRLQKYAGEGLMLSDITIEFLRKLETWMKKSIHELPGKEGLQPYATNTINGQFKYLGRIMRQARKEKLIMENPFEDFITPKYEQTDRVYLVDAELKKFIALLEQPLQDTFKETLLHFLRGCYTGHRHSDWVRFNYSKHVEGEFIKLRQKKNKTHVVAPIGITLRRVLDLSEHLPPPASNQKCNVMLKALASMAGVKKNVSTHTARHSFGYMCASNGLPESTTAALLGVSAKTVKVYYHLSGTDIMLQAASLKLL
jgi:integrase/recombinase XerD